MSSHDCRCPGSFSIRNLRPIKTASQSDWVLDCKVKTRKKFYTNSQLAIGSSTFQLDLFVKWAHICYCVSFFLMFCGMLNFYNINKLLGKVDDVNVIAACGGGTCVGETFLGSGILTFERSSGYFIGWNDQRFLPVLVPDYYIYGWIWECVLIYQSR